MINPAPLKERATPGLMTRVALFIIPGLYFVLPAFLFESGLFLLLSPLPLFLLTLKNTSWISLLALVTNSVVLFAFQDKAWIPLAFWLWSIVGVGFPILIKKFGKIVPAAAISFGIGLVVFYMTLTFVSLQDNVGVVEFLKRQIAFNLESLVQMPDSPIQKLVEEQGKDSVRREILDQFPSVVIISYLAVFWLNLLAASRIVKGFLTRSFWAGYKNPEWLVWPTLIFGTGFAFGKFALYYISLNAGKFLLALYFLQGLSIISFFLNKLKVPSFGRVVVYVGGFLVGSPLILSLGFFDQWFDFRKKFGQS